MIKLVTLDMAATTQGQLEKYVRAAGFSFLPSAALRNH